jgi:hypothetical protein
LPARSLQLQAFYEFETLASEETASLDIIPAIIRHQPGAMILQHSAYDILL